MLLSSKFWQNKKVLITGCTGFSGSWLVVFLHLLKSKIVGYSLKAPSEPNLFNILKLKDKIKLYDGDINNYSNLKKIILKEKPDIVFHLAANSIVLDCYKDPLNTYKTNSFGVLNLLEILRNYKKNISVNIVTSDKCYKNSYKRKHSFDEDSPLGGDDVYSASKATAEIMVNSYKNYFKKNIKIATIRSGNIIGGGDWGKYRLMTDIVLSKYKNKKINIRNFNAIRPWQHVYDVIHAYLLIAQYTSKTNQFHNWNVAPHNTRVSVKKIYSFFFKKEKSVIKLKYKNDVEKIFLSLDSKKIRKIIKWSPSLSYKKMMLEIENWYYIYYRSKNIKQHSYNTAKLFLSSIKHK